MQEIFTTGKPLINIHLILDDNALPLPREGIPKKPASSAAQDSIPP